jgi:hypothetical protein
MPKNLSVGDRTLDRLFLLIAAIAQNPGIGSNVAAKEAGLDPMDLIQQKMLEIAAAQGIEVEEWSIHTLRKDLKTLRQYGILAADAFWHGYYLGKKGSVEIPKRLRPPRQKHCKLSAQEIHALRAKGQTLQAIADAAGVSKEWIRQILGRKLE